MYKLIKLAVTVCIAFVSVDAQKPAAKEAAEKLDCPTILKRCKDLSTDT